MVQKNTGSGIFILGTMLYSWDSIFRMAASPVAADDTSVSPVTVYATLNNF